MFDARKAIDMLASAGITLRPRGDMLEVRFPIELTEQQLAWLKAHKHGLLWQLIHRGG